jgi:hypothetical protein
LFVERVGEHRERERERKMNLPNFLIVEYQTEPSPLGQDEGNDTCHVELKHGPHKAECEDQRTGTPIGRMAPIVSHRKGLVIACIHRFSVR